MANHLILNLEAPLMSFGGEIVDNLGATRPFPAVSMLTGLLVNALGWRRVERQRHQDLQDRLGFAARIDRESHSGLRTTDFQTAQLGANDRGWTTRGAPDERAGGLNTYNAPHLRYRDYHADMRVTVAPRLDPADGNPTLEDLATALEEPMRPLFIGRKPCLPSAPLFGGYSYGSTALEALLSVPLVDEPADRPTIRVQWPEGEGTESAEDFERGRAQMITDERNWVSGLHGGGRPIRQAAIEREKFAAGQQQEEGQP
ncbi:MAG: type I-E CRISPR-associated protein Cas5/CasD [Gammaproteobacteria bacterium]|nr:type I-E CRISPR-associated protein Cas5/CasD [Gammaproteobacteria bacterium]